MSGVISTAMVLAAGLGQRMRPLTDHVPKPLVKLAGETLIDRVLSRLAGAGVERAVVNLHYKGDVLERHLRDRVRPKVILSDERDALLDTGGGVVRALPLLGDAPFIVQNSDSVWIEGAKANIPALIDAWDPDRMDCLMLLASGPSSVGYAGPGDFVLAPDGRLSRRTSRETTPFVFAGVSIAHPRLLNGAPEGAFSLNVVWDRAIRDERLFGILLDGTWMHVGTPEAVIAAERAIAQAERV